jgi:hypothetical protein
MTMSPRPFGFLLTALAVAVSGCAQGPDIYSIRPELCTRHRVSVGDLVVSYQVGSTVWSLTDYTIRRGAIYYSGKEGPNIIKFGTDRVDLNNLNEGAGLFGSPPNKIGKDGEVYLLRDQFYIVIYEATPEYLDYALQASKSTALSWKPVPCPTT